MSFNARDTQTYRQDEKSGHKILAPQQREELVKAYLPDPPDRQRSSRRHDKKKSTSRFGIRSLLKAQLYLILYVSVHALFSLYIRLRMAYRAVTDSVLSILKYHHSTPDYVRRDISSLRKLPRHVSIILTLENCGRGGDAVERLVKELSEVTAWCASAGIPRLSVYERTGALKGHLHMIQRTCSHKLESWFGASQAPPLAVTTRGTATLRSTNFDRAARTQRPIELILISEDDGREALVDLTKVLASMVQKDKIKSKDITTEVINNEMTEAIMPEPDLLLSFEPYVDLQGYPPWPIRLTEIYCSPDNHGVGYQVFLRGLRKYSEATFKLGK
ncbi:Decaprenyl diphosphate synthase-like protein [Xylariomycetidae sp. FL2044]|nr:Decaprenyl diphosphate synthase-like protein [Xylariomycetidae sp. FL2044]